MPSFFGSSTVRSQPGHDPGLLLHAQHVLVFKSPSDPIQPVPSPPLRDVDVILTSSLVITFAGVLNNARVPSRKVARSAIAHHLRQFFQLNSAQLDLSSVSEIHLNDDGIPMLEVNIPHFHFEPKPHIALTSINLTYKFKSIPVETHTLMSDDDAVFSPKLSLPLASVLNEVIGHFVASQLVKRYPLIFGLSRKQLGIENAYVAPIVRSCLNIMKRCRDSERHHKCRTYIGILVRKCQAAPAIISASINRSLTGIDFDSQDLHVEPLQGTSDEDALCMALKQHLQRLIQPTQKFFLCDFDEEHHFSVEQFSPDDLEPNENSLPASGPCLSGLEDDDSCWLDDETTQSQDSESEWPSDSFHLYKNSSPLVSLSSSEGEVNTGACCTGSLATSSVPRAFLSWSPSCLHDGNGSGTSDSHGVSYSPDSLDLVLDDTSSSPFCEHSSALALDDTWDTAPRVRADDDFVAFNFDLDQHDLGDGCGDDYRTTKLGSRDFHDAGLVHRETWVD